MSAPEQEGEWGRGSPTSFGGPRQIHVPPPVLLAQFDTTTTLVAGKVQFRVPTPDSRVRAKITIIGAPDVGYAPDWMGVAGRSVALWLYASDDAQSGQSVPITDLSVGGTTSTKSTPVNIPLDAGLGGFSREVVTAADAVEGVLTISSAAGDGHTAGGIWLLTRYQPESGAYFPWDQWTEIRRECNPGRIGPVLLGA